MAMRKLIQDQKSFIEGEVSQAHISRLSSDYFSSCQKLENYVVNKDGSLTPRRGMSRIFTLPDDVRDYDEFIEFVGWRIFRVGTDIIAYIEQADGSLTKVVFDFNFEKVRAYNRASGNLSYDFFIELVGSGMASRSGVGIKNSHFDETLRPVKFKIIEDQLMIFFDNCYPFKLFFKDGFLVLAPFFMRNLITGEVRSIAENFPFSKTLPDVESGEFFFAKVGDDFLSAYSTHIQPNLVIFDEDLDTNECLAVLEPGYKSQVTGLANNFYVNKDFASLNHLLGRPIIFSVGPEKVEQDRMEYDPKVDDETHTPTAVNSILGNVAQKLYGTRDYEEWDKRKEDSDVYVPSDIVLPLFLPLGYRFYCIVPYERVDYSDEDTIENDVYVKASDFYTEAYKNRHGGAGSGSGFAKCRIFELGYVVDNSYTEGESTVRIIGGENFTFPASFDSSIPLNYAEDFVITDWAGGFPVDGGFLQGKHFYFTEDAKISFSKRDESNIFSQPQKVLLAINNYKFRYASNPYTYPLFRDYISKASSKGDFYDFLSLISWQKETLTLNVGDGLTYKVRSSDGNSISLLSFVEINIGAVGTRSVQVITATTSGIYYWGIGGGVSLNSFLTLFRVADFIVDETVGLISIHNKVYFTGRGGKGLYVVRFNERDQAFDFQLATSKREFEEVRDLAKFEEDRLLILQREGCYLANVEPQGSLSGFSNWNVETFNIEEIEKIEDYLASFILTKGANKYLYGYSEGNVNEVAVDQDEQGQDILTYTQVDLPPVTVSKYWPHHNIVTPRELNQIYLFSNGLVDLELGAGGENFRSLNRFDPDNRRISFEEDPLISVQLDLRGKRNSISFRQKVGAVGKLGGVSLSYYGDEING